jgi:uncharacterized protein
MDDPRPKLQTALKEAMVSKDNTRRDVIRMTLNALKQVEIDSQKQLNAEDALAILQKEAKKRRETIDEMENAGRSELAAQEKTELNVLEEFLPKQLSSDEITTLVKDAIAQSGATSANDMGKVMGVLMPKVKGLADGKVVNQIVRELLK